LSTLTFLLVAALGAPSSFDYVLEPGVQPTIEKLMAVPLGAPAGVKVEGAQINTDHVTFRFSGSEGDAEIEVRHESTAKEGDVTIDGLAVRTQLDPSSKLRKAFIMALKGLASRVRFRARARQGVTSNPLKVARAKLYMLDKAGVRKAAKAALKAAPGDRHLRAEVALLLHAAGLTEEALAQRAKIRSDLQWQADAAAILLSLDTIDRAPSPTDMGKVLSLAEKGACVLTLVGDAYYLTERYKEALDVVDRVLKVAPKCSDAHHLGAEVAARKLDWTDLLARVELAEKQLGKAKNFTIHHATALRGLKRYDEARELIEPIVRANPQTSGALAMLTNLYNLTMTKEDVFRDLRKRYLANPKDLISHYLAGVMGHYLGRHKDCVEILETLVDKMPSEPRVSMYAAVSAYFIGQKAKAERLIAKSHAIAGAMDPDVFYCRSIIVREKDIKMAIRDLERFLTVARFGWHSDGKIERVQGELAQLKKGIIPPPAEPHHRMEDGTPLIPSQRARANEAAKPVKTPSDTVEEEVPTPLGSTKTGATAMLVLVLLLYAGWRFVARSKETR
jgi:tetratricopeptide (TPR) repeat protein